MSHVCQIKTTLQSLEATKATCKALGLTFVEGQPTYNWWGHHAGDYPVPTGFKVSDLGKCEHAIKVPGTDWEIGVTRARNPDGSLCTGYTLLCDYYGGKGRPIAQALGCDYHPHMLPDPQNRKLKDTGHLCDGLDGRPCYVKSLNFHKFMHEYAVQQAMLAARAKGYLATRKPQPNGRTQVVVTGF